MNREEIVGSVGVWPLKLLAKRWVCSDTAIRDREKAGLLKRCKGVPGVCYTAASVAECEGWDGNQNPMSPFERRKLSSCFASSRSSLRAMRTNSISWSMLFGTGKDQYREKGEAV